MSVAFLICTRIAHTTTPTLINILQDQPPSRLLPPESENAGSPYVPKLSPSV
ncbi:hypothetical protein BDV24DRAFT_75413 [Aspergillus arachidicola]|uniref:Uncharacterized protein n=1 Tax=Aspergillus arachidicola TaxID=656916 RepID=A0A5N6Y1V5_9EURO|nr:hypothetical protein BDV24DRAFT_75413 [Aspergillus arachidicola]